MKKKKAIPGRKPLGRRTGHKSPKVEMSVTAGMKARIERFARAKGWSVSESARKLTAAALELHAEGRLEL